MPNEESFVRKMDDPTITPASITVVPDLYHQATGSVSVSAPDMSLSASASYDLFTSWRVMGPLDVDLTTSWNTGESTWYWYRVEGFCGPVICDEMGVQYSDCDRMTFVTTVSARNLSELCETLSNPRTNAPVNLLLSSIKRYSRPVFRNQIQPDQCNVLEDVEYCQIPECMDYCPEEDSASLFKFSNLVTPTSDFTEESPKNSGDQPESPKFSELSDVEGVLVASAVPSASVSGLGYEYDEIGLEYDMQPPTNFISACGCLLVGPSVSVRHTLGRSSAFSGFLRSNGLSMPRSISLTHKSFDSSWGHTSHLRSQNSAWTVQISMSCVDDLWRLSLSAREGSRQTRLVVDIPSDLMCTAGRPSALVQVYFDRGIDVLPSGGTQVVTPPRPLRKTATDAAEVFVSGIFVPYVVYYDDLGLFKDVFWEYSPLEIDINPSAKNPTTLMTLDGIA